MEDQPDEVVLGRWAEGDRSAGATLVERHYARVERFFSTKLAADVDDLVQQTFLACLEAAPRFRAESTFKTFLYGVARNLLFAHFRRQRRSGASPPDFGAESVADLGPGMSTIIASNSELRRLVSGLQTLPVDLQIVLELHYWEGLGVEELAEVQQVPPGTVKSRLFRARQLLRTALGA